MCDYDYIFQLSTSEKLNVTTNKFTLCAAAAIFSSVVSCAAVYAASSVAQDRSPASNPTAVAAVTADDVQTKAVVKKGKNAKNTNKVVKKANKKATTNAADIHQSFAREIHDLKVQVADLQKQKEIDKTGIAWSKLYAYGPAVVTTPIVGEPRYDGADLYVNSPSINEDLALLKLNQKLDSYYAQNNIHAFDRPIFALSGLLEAQALNYSAFNTPRKSDINLATAAIEGVARINSWVNGLVRFEYKNDATPDAGTRASGSTVKLKRGYITVGNLDRFPLYASVGQMYVPFGQYDNWRITDPLTLSIARTESRPLVVGFSKDGAYGSLYAFKGDTYTDGSNTLKQWGANLGYTYVASNWKLDFGAGYIANIADAAGMQDTGYTAAGGFAGFKNGLKIKDRVRAADGRATLTYGPVALTTEYITALDSFNKYDMTFNGDGAKPRALDIEGVYNFKVLDKPSFVTAGYGQTWESLALNLPRYSYFIAVGTSMFKSTWQCIEFRHDINYDNTDAAYGQGKPVIVGAKERDLVIASFKIFF